uniref:hypothetical protein n=1 Tax=Rhodospora sordida TaxID=362230 RepID=UPI001FCE0A82|nr:hypothetical protein MW557_pgp153 [Rhodospora sordida]UNJ14941.1 hypothetical protein [Rhodospora sordida]
MHRIDIKLQTLLQQIDFRSIDITQKQIELIQEVSNSQPEGLNALVDILYEHRKDSLVFPLDGVIYEKLIHVPNPEIQEFLRVNFSLGIVPLKSEKNIDYTQLQQLLLKKNFLQADILTQQKLCELASINAQTRSWLYFTDILNLPTQDLQTIDNLWRIHSHNRFGFSIQKQIWNTVNKNREKLFHRIQWIVNKDLCRYPQEFTWDLSAPPGHLPLFNQLRGTQVLTFLLSHKAWQTLE